MLCVNFLGQFQLPDPKSYISIGWVIVVLFAIAGGVLVLLRIRNEARKSRESETGGEQRRLLPDPLRVKHIDDDWATRAWVEGRVSAIEKEVTRKMDGHQRYVHDKFHKLESDLQAIKSEGEDRGEAAIEQIGALASEIKENAVTLAGVKEKAENTERIVIQMNGKLDRAIEREIPPKRR